MTPETKDQGPATTTTSSDADKATVTPVSSDTTKQDQAANKASVVSPRTDDKAPEASARPESRTDQGSAPESPAPQAAHDRTSAVTPAPTKAGASAANQRAQAAGALAKTGAENVDMYLATGVAAVAGGVLLTRQARYVARHAGKRSAK